ncbi:MAG: GYD domain protein, partial [Chloroflexota bacterium]|nr:GYD domain protein [Chloroflexota bacterium]
MPKYLVKASYNPAGAQGLLAEGGSARRDALTASVESVDGPAD